MKMNLKQTSDSLHHGRMNMIMKLNELRTMEQVKAFLGGDGARPSLSVNSAGLGSIWI